MSEDNVERHRALYRAMNGPDLEAMVALCDAAIEVHSAFATVGGGIYHGRDGVRRWVQDMYETWGPEFLADPQAYFDLGETTLVDALIHGRGTQSGLRTAMPVTAVARWRDGRCTVHKAFPDRRAALREAGVTEADLTPIEP